MFRTKKLIGKKHKSKRIIRGGHSRLGGATIHEVTNNEPAQMSSREHMERIRYLLINETSDRGRLVLTARKFINIIIGRISSNNVNNLIDEMLDKAIQTKDLIVRLRPDGNSDYTYEDSSFDTNISELRTLLLSVFSDRYTTIFPPNMLKFFHKKLSIYTQPRGDVPDFGNIPDEEALDDMIPEFGGKLYKKFKKTRRTRRTRRSRRSRKTKY
jgi:hypothetical protein